MLTHTHTHHTYDFESHTCTHIYVMISFGTYVAPHVLTLSAKLVLSRRPLLMSTCSALYSPCYSTHTLRTHTYTQPSTQMNIPAHTHTHRQTHARCRSSIHTMCVYVCVCQRGKTPLHFSSLKHLAVTTLLLDRGADVNVKDDVRGTHTHTFTYYTHDIDLTSTHTHLRNDIYWPTSWTSRVGVIRTHTYT